MSRPTTRVVVFALIVTGALACATGDRPSGTSGFLGDYSNLAIGRGNQARLVYLRAEADFSAYDAIIIEPVIVWDAKQAGPALHPSEESEEQAAYFGRALREQLGDAYQLVETRRPRTMLLRMAIVEGLGSGVNIECELIDAMSRERLVAAVDHRELSAATEAAPAAADAKPVYDRWALIIRNRLVALRDFDASLNDADATATD